MKTRVAVGLSGGVDSSVAALLLKKAGYDVIGISMNLWENGRYHDGVFEGCFGPGSKQAMADAAELAKQIDIPFEIFDCAEAFENNVIKVLKEERERGRTPNPCVMCNPILKFGILPQEASKHIKFDYFATGHYVRINNLGNRFSLLRSTQKAKDQSYFLWGLSQEQLSRVMFPLGSLSKDEVRTIAREAHLAMAEKTDSQDFYSGDTDKLFEFTPKEGDVIDLSGKVLAKHNGYWHFTVGQRKGLGFAIGKPCYVIDIDACRNRITIGTREEAISTSFKVDQETLNWVSIAPTSKKIECRVKVRSAGDSVGPVIYENGVVTAPNGVFGVAPGQSAVFYDLNDDTLLFGAVIL